MSDTIANYRRALTAFDEILGAVQPDQWANPTPCPDWTARDIAGHVTGGQQMVHAFITGAEPANPWVGPARLAGTDPATTWRETRDAATAQVTPEVLDRSFTDMSRPDAIGGFVTVITFDLLGHTWDLAQATGQQVTLPADLVEQMLAWGKFANAACAAPDSSAQPCLHRRTPTRKAGSSPSSAVRNLQPTGSTEPPQATHTTPDQTS
jgi:uncharacterized protein (TIGR03086 family)